MMGVADLPSETLKALKIHPKSVTKKRIGSKTSIDPKSPGRTNSYGPDDDASTIADDAASTVAPSAMAARSVGQLSLTSSNLSSASFASDTATQSANDPTVMNSPELDLSLVSLPSPGTAEGTPSVRTPRDAFVTQALGQSLGGSRPRSRSKHGSPSRRHTSESFHRVDSSSKFHVEAALGTGKGISRFVGAGLKSPMDFTMALARGFHNAPKLYGDQVRQTDKITDLQSGLKAAGKVFAHSVMPLVFILNEVRDLATDFMTA